MSEELKSTEETPELAKSPVEDAAEDRYHTPENLFRIASWSNILSWVILAISVVIIIGNLFQQFQQGFPPGLMGVLYFASLIIPLLVGAFFFIFLQAIAEGIYVLMDIEENTRTPKQ
jgi:hypothetical protein